MSSFTIESRDPQVGIWWYIGGVVHAFADDARTVRTVAGFKDSDFLHDTEWPKLSRFLEIKGSYISQERGRVIHREKDDKFIINCSTVVSKDKKALNKIAREFSLPLSKVRVSVDEHYNPPDEDFDDELDLYTMIDDDNY